ncbi:MgtC/SapB family protein [Teichococcus vastitatis]|uniref:Protein MgtC n=1 Tax=Teichococcus vastitatis TaxID=2307076 RepID=A0ABS9VZY9_9PROT|nr:MgtC/SapB family protein [Pseudoroseomonas vastitatis]MCI0752488.1 MgtC/SapB family protein [Pseudoroseomonas vastitatis]
MLPDDPQLAPALLQIRDLVVAYVLALPIGWDREREDRSAGLRTFPLVALASCGFLQAAGVPADINADAVSRILQGLTTGIGFVGAGAIIRDRGRVHGTATAAGLWVTGAIGAAVALHAFAVAVMLSLATVLTLRGLQGLKPQRKDKA